MWSDFLIIVSFSRKEPRVLLGTVVIMNIHIHAIRSLYYNEPILLA